MKSIPAISLAVPKEEYDVRSWAMFDGWPLFEFAQSIGAKNLAMLVAYVDDTGTHGDSDSVGLLGLLGDSVTWARLEPDWKKELSVTGVSWFHATDCENGEGEFQVWDRPFRDALIKALIRVVGKHPVLMIGSLVFRRDWEDATPAKIKERFGNDPLYFCFEHCMQQISKWSKDNAHAEPVSLVFAEQQRYQSSAEILHGLYRRSEEYGNLGSFSTAKPKCVIPLQAADLVAYESYQHFYRSRFTNQPMRWQLRDLLHSGLDSIAQFHDKNSLAATYTMHGRYINLR